MAKEGVSTTTILWVFAFLLVFGTLTSFLWSRDQENILQLQKEIHRLSLLVDGKEKFDKRKHQVEVERDTVIEEEIENEEAEGVNNEETEELFEEDVEEIEIPENIEVEEVVEEVEIEQKPPPPQTPVNVPPPPVQTPSKPSVSTPQISVAADYFSKLTREFKEYTFATSCDLEFIRLESSRNSKFYASDQYCPFVWQPEHELHYAKRVQIFRKEVELEMKANVVLVDIKPLISSNDKKSFTSSLISILEKYSQTKEFILYYESLIHPNKQSETQYEWMVEAMEKFLDEHICFRPIVEPFFMANEFVWILKQDTSDVCKQVQQTQFPTDCKASNYFLGDHHEAGMGSFFSVTSRGQAASYLNKKIFLYRGNWKVYGDTRCDARTDALFTPSLEESVKGSNALCCNAQCIFLRASNCSYSDALQAFREEHKDLPPLDHLASIDDYVNQHKLTTTMENSRVHFGHAGKYDNKIESKEGPYYDYFDDFKKERIIFYNNIFRPQRWARKLMKERVNQALGVDSNSDRVLPPYISMHIRHGDRVEHPHIATTTYYQFAKDYLDFHSVKYVFIATDDEEAIEELRKSHPDLYIAAPIWPRDRGSHPTPGVEKMLTEAQRKNPRETLLNLLLEMYAIQRSEYFLGTGGSNLTYLATHLIILHDPEKSMFYIEPRLYPIPGQSVA